MKLKEIVELLYRNYLKEESANPVAPYEFRDIYSGNNPLYTRDITNKETKGYLIQPEESINAVPKTSQHWLQTDGTKKKRD